MPSSTNEGGGGAGDNDYGSIDKISIPPTKNKYPGKGDEEEPLLKTPPATYSHPINDDISPVENASWYSKLLFSWLNPLFRTGNTQEQLSPDDISSIPLLPSDTTNSISDVFETHWEEEKKRAAIAKAKALDKAKAKGRMTSMEVEKATPSLTRCLWKSFGWDFCKAGFLKAVHDVLQFVGPQVLNGLIHYIRDANAPIREGLLLTAAVSLAQVVMSLALRHYFFGCFRVGLKTRTCMVTAIYKKALVLSSAERGKRTVGEITNLMSVDSQRLQDTTTYLHAIWYSALQIGLSIYFLWQQLGVSCLAGVVIICIMIPVTKEIAGWMGRLQKSLMKAKDKRIEVHNEVFGSMKVIKIQGWEEAFQDRIKELRKIELRRLFQYILGRCLNYMMWTSVPLFIALATFATYVFLGNTLDVASALTALALFDILRFPLFLLPTVINAMVEASVSLRRIESFLLGEEQTLVGRGNLKDVGIKIDNGTFVYDSKRPKAVDSSSSSATTSTKDDKKGGNLVDKRIAKDLDDSKWEVQLLRSQLADAENKIKELLKTRKYGGAAAEAEDDNEEEKQGMSASSNSLLSLRRIDFQCGRGELIAVVGAVGSGKSTFINSLLGDVKPVSGEVSVNGKLAYFAQNPFIMNDTVKGNILFGGMDAQQHGGNNINVARYRTAIEACALSRDLEALPNGDMCEIGEKGVTLSGGQKARVAMARAVYHDPDIYLLDDPLAAVDAHVGRHIFEKCIIDELILGKGSIWSNRKSTNNKIVVLVTNALQYLRNPHVGRIVVLKNGIVEEIGSYRELTNDPDKKVFKSFLATFNESSSENVAGDKEDEEIILISEEEGAIDAPISELDPDSLPSKKLKYRPQKRSSGIRRKSFELMLPKFPPPPSEKGRRSKSVLTNPSPSFESERATENAKSSSTDELQERSIGHVSKEIYLAWLRAAGGVSLGVLIPLFFLGVESLNVLSQWWLTYWSGHGEEVSQLKFLAIYAIINLSAVLAMFLRMVIVMFSGLRASNKLFSKMLDVTLRAPLAFFDVTPLGRIMNRFSKDIYTLDEQLPSVYQMYLSTIIKVLGVIVVISSVTPIFTLCLVPIVVFYKMQQEFFTRTYRELKRIDSVSRSPIYALFQETLDGISTIRAFSAQSSLLRRITSMLDKQQNAYFLTFSSQCWLGVRLELVATLIVSFACLCAVFQHSAKGGDEIYAGLAGLSISFALSVTQSLNWSVRMSSELEAHMVAIERIEQYANIESEAARRVDDDKDVGSSWPSTGAIEFKRVKMRYRPGLPLVLKGLDLVIPSHSKVGIVGRTGAGKSSLMVALLRIVELDSGSICIDGVNIRNIGLQMLRTKIAVIPQDPSLFSGSVRSNLDPFDEYSDSRLRQVLIRVGLMSDTTEGDVSKKHSSHCIRSLADEVIEGGSNFSVGQRQLLVIARALLRESSIVIMDEATAAVDADTDAMIQRVMRIDFKDATCLTIAHRLNTIMDSDFILVMDDGVAAEFDPPSELMSKGGLFKDLVDTWEEDKKK